MELDIDKLHSLDIVPGTAVIINYFDRPYCRLVAVVTLVEYGVVHVKYLCQEVEQDGCHDLIERVTPISKFGVRLEFGNRTVKTYPESESKAVYADGRPRNWQETYNDEYVLKKDIFPPKTNFSV